jgi:hypothetical protein
VKVDAVQGGIRMKGRVREVRISVEYRFAKPRLYHEGAVLKVRIPRKVEACKVDRGAEEMPRKIDVLPAVLGGPAIPDILARCGALKVALVRHDGLLSARRRVGRQHRTRRRARGLWKELGLCHDLARDRRENARARADKMSAISRWSAEIISGKQAKFSRPKSKTIPMPPALAQ